jgi:hypothetical protein
MFGGIRGHCHEQQARKKKRGSHSIVIAAAQASRKR